MAKLLTPAELTTIAPGEIWVDGVVASRRVTTPSQRWASRSCATELIRRKLGIAR